MGHVTVRVCIWWFPEIGVPPNDPYFREIFPSKPTILDTPISMETPIYTDQNLLKRMLQRW